MAEDKETFETDNINEVVERFEKQKHGADAQKDRKKKDNEDTAERSIHAHRTHESSGWNRKFARGYDNIDWSK